MKKITALLFGLFLGFAKVSSAETKYWIMLKDKPLSPIPSLSAKSLSNRHQLGLYIDETDFPIHSSYLNTLSQYGIKLLLQSRWLNAVSAELSTEQVKQVSHLPFVKELVPIDQNIVIASLSHQDSDFIRTHLAPVMSQIQADVFARAGLTAKNITIGVIDAGYFGADSASALKHIFKRNGISAIHDYVNPNRPKEAFFCSLETLSDFHGTEVLAAISGLDSIDNVQYGLATDATFCLARTDHGAREFRGEEDNWIAAMEWMDSLGVRIINTSLGYAKGFSNPKENYQPSQMNGKTSLISQAAQLAAEKKGILIIVSAGNEGDDRSWRIISTPADAKGVLAVGATNSRVWNRIGYSSIGPEFLPYMKPNVSCFSLYGTSLSAPVITGFAACLMQANPALTNKELIGIIEKASHLYPHGNNYIGYGVPQASRALALAKGQMVPSTAKSIPVSGKTHTLGLTEYADKTISVFHKKDAIHVLQQEAIRVQNGKVTLRRIADEKQTTIDLKKEVIELIWE